MPGSCDIDGGSEVLSFRFFFNKVIAALLCILLILICSGFILTKAKASQVQRLPHVNVRGECKGMTRSLTHRCTMDQHYMAVWSFGFCCASSLRSLHSPMYHACVCLCLSDDSPKYHPHVLVCLRGSNVGQTAKRGDAFIISVSTHAPCILMTHSMELAQQHTRSDPDRYYVDSG